MTTENSTVLLDCLNRQKDNAKVERLARVTSDAWQAVMTQAALQRVTPLFYQRLLDLGISLPAEIEAQLKQAYQQNYRRNKILFLELRKVLRSLREAGVPAITFKGLHLAGEVYHNIGARLIGDIDLLVHPADLNRIEEIMFKIGCRPLHYNRVIGPAIYDFSYVLPQTNIRVEFHWALIYARYSFEPDLFGIWARAQEISLSDTALLVMSPEDLLLYLCLHMTKHWNELHLNQLCDIAEVLQRYETQLDWPAIEGRAKQWKIVRSVYLALRLAQELLDAPLPVDRLDALQPSDFREHYLTLALEQFLAEPAERGERFASPFAVVEIWGTKGLGNKIAILWRRLFPPPETIALLYPAPAHSWRIYPFYLVRIKDLLARFGKDAWQLLRGDPQKQELVARTNRAKELHEWLKST